MVLSLMERGDSGEVSALGAVTSPQVVVSGRAVPAFGSITAFLAAVLKVAALGGGKSFSSLQTSRRTSIYSLEMEHDLTPHLKEPS